MSWVGGGGGGSVVVVGGRDVVVDAVWALVMGADSEKEVLRGKKFAQAIITM